jgi:glycosyltransferase involved in cell wall biosynthesis
MVQSFSNSDLASGTYTLETVICTRNRAALLALALDALVEQAKVMPQLSVAVVDNMSEDHTADVIASACAQIPGRIRMLKCDKIGENCARNHALHSSTSDLIAYIDDDAVPEQHWAAAILSTFQTAGPRLVAVAGAIDPVWGGPVPDWLTPDIAAYYSVLDLGPKRRPITPHESFVAANVAFRRDALLAVGGFHEQLGRVGASLFSNGEVFTCRALQQREWTIVYEPEMRVRHNVAADRLTWAWLSQRLYQQGRSDVVMWALLAPGRSRLTHLKDAFAYCLRWAWNLRRFLGRSSAESRKTALCSFYLLAGRAIGSAELAINPRC